MTVSVKGARLGLSRDLPLYLFAGPLLLAGLCLPTQAQETSLISVSSTGELADGENYEPSASADARLVAWESGASNLVAGDTNDELDIFVRDMDTGEVTRINTGPSGQEGDGSSYAPRITPDGRYVAYWSRASNLAAGDDNDAADVFLHDRDTGVTELISVSSAGELGDDESFRAKVTNNGRYVLFESQATNLVPGDTNGETDVFVRDRQQGETFRVSVSSTGAEGDDDSGDADMSGDGRFIVFESSATNLVPGDTNGEGDVFLHDRLTGETSLVSAGPLGESGDDFSDDPAISADGNWVVYDSYATNLVAGDVNGQGDVFLYDVQAGQTSLVSVNDAGEQGDGRSVEAQVCQDGRYVIYESDATNLVPGDTNDEEDIFVYERLAGEVRRVNVGPLGQQADRSSEEGYLSPEGRWAVFRSYSDTILDEDNNGNSDVFIHGPLFDEGPGPLATLATLDLFAVDDVDVRDSHVDGVITAGKLIYLEHFSSAARSELTSESDVVISGGRLKGMDGTVMRGNGVYGTDLELDPSVVFSDSSQDPRVDSPLDFGELSTAARNISTSWGLTPATGTTVVEYHNITVEGFEPDVNYFVVAASDLADARMVTVCTPPGSASIINVDGAHVSKAICGIRLKGTAAENVIFNFFEGERIVLGNFNLEASVLAPFARLTVQTISVSGNLIANNLRLRNAGTRGQLFSLEPWQDSASDHFHAGEDGVDMPDYTLTWTAQSVDEVIEVVHQGEDVLEVWVDGEVESRVRLDRLERLVFTERSDLSGILIDPEITLPVELSGLAPVAQDDHVALKWGGSGTADVLANDLAGPAALDPASVELLTVPRFGTAVVDPATGAVTYSCVQGVAKPAGIRCEVLEYTVRDANGNQSTPRRVRFSFKRGDAGGLDQR